MDVSYLEEIGLTKNESIVYLTLLELGPSLAGEVAKKSGLHRRSVYDVSEMLIKKGLIGYILRNNRRLFSASNPERLLDLVREKEEMVGGMMPDLVKLFSKTKDKEETNFYKGKAGLKMVFEDQISNGGEIKIIGASPLAYEILQFYFHWFDKRRVKEKIRTKVIFNKVKGVDVKIPLSEVRYLSEKYSSPLAVNIYGDKVALIMWSKENPFAIVINQKEIAEGYRNYFELMWKIAKR